MWHPERAVIKTPTLDEACRLVDFCSDLGFRHADDAVFKWEIKMEETCFDYLPLAVGGYSLYTADREWYYENRESDADISQVPEEFFMLTVDEFISICRCEDSAEDTLVDLDSLL